MAPRPERKKMNISIRSQPTERGAPLNSLHTKIPHSAAIMGGVES